jgi:hypothetical protein
MTKTMESNREFMSLKGGETQTVPASTDTEERQTVTKSEVFDVLKNERRRAVIQFLDDRGGSGTLSEVAELIAAEENDTTVERLTSSERKRVRIALYQCHLPRMHKMGVVDFDKHRGTIALRDPAAEVLLHLNVAPRGAAAATDSSDRFIVAFAVGVAGLVTAGALGVGALSAVPPSGWTEVAALALVAIAGWHWRRGRAPDDPNELIER